jgi:hypothetical protein
MFQSLNFAKIESTIGRALETPVIGCRGPKRYRDNETINGVFYSLAEVTFCQGEDKGSLRKAIDWGSIVL